jgi:hypothetical protein
MNLQPFKSISGKPFQKPLSLKTRPKMLSAPRCFPPEPHRGAATGPHSQPAPTRRSHGEVPGGMGTTGGFPATRKTLPTRKRRRGQTLATTARCADERRCCMVEFSPSAATARLSERCSRFAVPKRSQKRKKEKMEAWCSWFTQSRALACFAMAGVTPQCYACIQHLQIMSISIVIHSFTLHEIMIEI